MSVIDEVKARLDIIDVVSGYISLKKGGRTYKANCPFHGEKTPSFVVFPESQSWRCFGACNEGGDVFSFVRKMEGWDFREALQALAQRAGVELEAQSPEALAKKDSTERLVELVGRAADYYFELLLNHPAAETTRQYIYEKRGLTPDTVQQFKLGFALEQWDAMLNHLRRQGYGRDEIIAAGLAVENEQGRVYDRFRQRLMIPISDARGRVVGFGARALVDGQEPKYLNSPQGSLFDKSRLLYGFDLARRAIRESETVVVVEGYMDAIQAHQAGYTNVVAQMGTALTETQVRQLAKYANKLVLALDTDAAGAQATMRGLDVVRESLLETRSQSQTVFDAGNMVETAGRLSLDVRVLRLPEGKDPDEFLRANPHEWPELINGAQSLVDYVIDTGTQGLGAKASIQEREQVAKQLLPLLTATENNLYRHENIQRLAIKLKIAENTLLGWSHSTQKNAVVRNKATARPSNTSSEIPKLDKIRQNGGSALERYCLASLLDKPDWLFLEQGLFRQLAAEVNGTTALLDKLNGQDFSSEELRVLFDFIEAAIYEGVSEVYAYVCQEIPQELLRLVEDVAKTGKLEAFQHASSQMHNTELASIIREQQHLNAETHRESDAFLMAVLKLRLDRLKRERNERYFYVNMAEYTDETVEGFNHTYMMVYARAQNILERAVYNLTRQRQKQSGF